MHVLILGVLSGMCACHAENHIWPKTTRIHRREWTSIVWTSIVGFHASPHLFECYNLSWTSLSSFLSDPWSPPTNEPIHLQQLSIVEGRYKYMLDLLQLEGTPPGQHSLPFELCSTPIQRDMLVQGLASHPDPKFVAFIYRGLGLDSISVLIPGWSPSTVLPLTIPHLIRTKLLYQTI